ncbi:hypothetical protein TH25_02430 [Thalassospira profundimaris]|uniref:Uncharacterized protein n=1 Tax=Thalassospira profundimaris TaxID=502049 RepID=A0A367XKM0_9PROT|nr:type II toxin-antitoxin system PemK/MazF family toxin [Thalassospira profundimaris]RCK54196.1 hypothetical protein TH25_02430 [Thalassospira profundimaris]
MDKGDVYHINLNPTKGREQAGERFVMVVSPASYNQIQLPIIVPITQGGGFARETGFAVSLSGTGSETQGVVMCNQVRTLDIKSRNGRYIETLPDFIVDDVQARLIAIFE